MNAKRTGLIIVFLIALLLTGCGTDSNDQLKPPAVYKNPQVKITHAPTEMVVEQQPTAEASAVATDQIVSTLPDETFEEPELEDQVFIDNVENLLNQIENELERLERMDKNP